MGGNSNRNSILNHAIQKISTHSQLRTPYILQLGHYCEQGEDKGGGKSQTQIQLSSRTLLPQLGATSISLLPDCKANPNSLLV